jgi:hypothetical protein
LARESGGAVAGVRPDDSQNDLNTESGTVAASASAEDELSLALAELEVGEVLFTSAVATAAQQEAARAQASLALSDVIEHLDTAAGYLAQVGDPAASGLLSGSQPSPKAFFDQLPKTVNGIIDRTAGLGLATVKGLTKIPVAQLQPAFDIAWSASETALGAKAGAGALMKAAMRAVARALQALTQLVPEKLRQQVRDWAGDWWQRHAEDVAERLARRLLSAAELEIFIAKAVGDAEKRTDLDNFLKQGYSRLVELDGRHARIMKVIGQIVAVLSRLVGPLALAFPWAAPWVYGSGGGGMVTALGVSMWIGRDYLDAGVPFEREPGVRVIVTDAIIAPA